MFGFKYVKIKRKSLVRSCFLESKMCSMPWYFLAINLDNDVISELPIQFGGCERILFCPSIGYGFGATT